MSVGFAGARTLDDRRRRRLAQNAETAKRRAPTRPASATAAAQPQFAASPIESLVRPQMWVNVLLAALGLSVCGGAIYLGEWIAVNYPAANQSFGPRGLLIRSLSVVHFVFAAQLAAAIHWYRARSRKDFNGRYRVWHFVVPSLLAFGFCAATDGHRVLAGWAQGHWQLTGPHVQTLLWMVPTGAVLLAMVRLLHTEMRGTGGAAPSLWMVILAAMINAAVLFDAPVPVKPEIAEIAGRSAMLLWPLGLVLALLFYARRVIYVTNEPSALPATDDDPASSHRRWLNWWKPRQSSRRQKVSDEKTAPTAKSGKNANPPASRAPSPSVAEIEELPETTRENRPVRTLSAATPPAGVADEPPAPAKPAPDPADASSGHLRPSDQSHDEDDDFDEDDPDHHSLSKKERKKLRKLQQRERRRAFS